MKKRLFKISLLMVALVFTIIFIVVVIPPFIESPNILAAFKAGFVNPFAAGYSFDVFCCWFILLFWVLYDYPKVKYGWVSLIIGVIPGVAVGFAVYLLLRTSQLKSESFS